MTAVAARSGSSAGVGLVLVSHSAGLAAGLRDLVLQMAPEVAVALAGGTADGELGTSADLVVDAVRKAESGSGVVLLYDLGSARMSAELACELLEPEEADRVLVVVASFVEGALAAGVAAAGGQSLSEVAAAAQEAGRNTGDQDDTVPSGADVDAGASDATSVRREAVLRDPAGLHARPAARVVRALRGLAAQATVALPDGRSAVAASLTGLLALGASTGSRLTVAASGRDADVALQRIVEVLVDASVDPVDEVPTGGYGTEAVPAAPGRAVGPLNRCVLAPVTVPHEAYGGESYERARLDRAVRDVRDELSEGDLASAHRVLLEDPALLDAAYRCIAAGATAPAAWSGAVGQQHDTLESVPDPLIAARAVDISDVGQRVLGVLTGHPVQVSVPAGSVVLADDLPPSHVTSLAEQGAVGFVLRAGGARSHAAVLARAAGVPMVVAAGEALDVVQDGARVVVDGTTGEVGATTEPPAAAMVTAASGVVGPLIRPDGSRLRVAANVGSAADARAAAAAGAEGIGLLRTELLFTGRPTLPDEAEQVSWLTGILENCPPGPVVVRTVDLGGDKPVPGLRLDAVRHGFLGVRGLRLCLARPDLFDVHLRAVLRAAAVRPVELMFPFVTEPAEIRAARHALERAAAALRTEGVAYAMPTAVGMMVEIPTAAVQIQPFLPLVDFLSVGSNDLAQYLSASDRTVGAVAGTYRAGERAVPELVAALVAAAGPVGIPVAVCGDLAGDPQYARELVSAGVSELSVAAPLVARLRSELGRLLAGQAG